MGLHKEPFLPQASREEPRHGLSRGRARAASHLDFRCAWALGLPSHPSPSRGPRPLGMLMREQA